MILGVGTVALDGVETPAGSVHEVPGGSALYFAAAASRLGPVAIVGVTGADFPAEPLSELAAHGVDVSAVVRFPDPTFRWFARYDESGNREVLSVHRGGIVARVPEVPPTFRDPDILFLGSTDPTVQRRVLNQAGHPGWVVLDTMPHWIRERRTDLVGLLHRVHVLLVNEEEVRLLGGAPDEAAAARAVLLLGPGWVVVKRGARGACAYGTDGPLEVEAVAVERVVDPTGAGDAFAGGLVASLAGGAALGGRDPAAGRGPGGTDMRRALEVGSAMGALAVRDFSFKGLLGGRSVLPGDDATSRGSQ